MFNRKRVHFDLSRVLLIAEDTLTETGNLVILESTCKANFSQALGSLAASPQYLIQTTNTGFWRMTEGLQQSD